MRVGVYTGANHPVGPALIEGCLSVGAQASPRCSQYHRGEVESFDLVVVYGARAGARVRQCYEAAGVPVVTVDWGYMARVNTREERETGHYQIGRASCRERVEVAAGRATSRATTKCIGA